MFWTNLLAALVTTACAQIATKTEEARSYSAPPMKFVDIRRGTFQMGSPESEVERWDDETLHSVTLTVDFQIQDTEVTQAQWFAVMNTNPSEFKRRENCLTEHVEIARVALCPGFPVDMISWNDAQDFAAKLNEKRDGYQYRLPTEQEWEFAARGGTKTAYTSGDDIRDLNDLAWHEGNSGRQTHPVAKKKPNRIGLYDVHGNVWEWVSDLYPNLESRIMRGGSWGNDAYGMRLANRGMANPAIRSIGVGFRLVRTIDPETSARMAEVILISRNGETVTIQNHSRSKTAQISLADFKARMNAALVVPKDYRPEIRKQFELHQKNRQMETDELKQSFERLSRFVGSHKTPEAVKFRKQLRALGKKIANNSEIPIATHELNLLSDKLVDHILGLPGFQKSLDPKTDAGFELNIARSYLKAAKVDGKFVNIPAGTFQMGSPLEEPERDANEIPHAVTLTKSFQMQETKVTQAQWFTVMGYNPSEFKQRRHCPEFYEETDGESMCARNPVESVSWLDAQVFIRRLNESGDGFTYRLPTEAEREYAGRGGNQTTYSSGSDTGTLLEAAWFFPNAGDFTRAVGLKKRNPYGLYDVHGNVWEWVADWYGEYPSDPRLDPGGPPTSRFRSIRGGSWFSVAKYLRSANRGNAPSEARSGIIGFRLVRTLTQNKKSAGD